MVCSWYSRVFLIDIPVQLLRNYCQGHVARLIHTGTTLTLWTETTGRMKIYQLGFAVACSICCNNTCRDYVTAFTLIIMCIFAGIPRQTGPFPLQRQSPPSGSSMSMTPFVLGPNRTIR